MGAHLELAGTVKCLWAKSNRVKQSVVEIVPFLSVKGRENDFKSLSVEPM